MRSLISAMCLLLLIAGCAKPQPEVPIGIWEKEDEALGYMKFTLYSGRAEVIFVGMNIKFQCALRGRSIFSIPENPNGGEVEIGKFQNDGTLLLLWVPNTIDDSGGSPYRLKKSPNQPVETTTARAAVVRTPHHLAPAISPSLAAASHF